MPPKKGKKKGKGKKKKEPRVDPGLTEVDKTFYELTIADLNRKLARLRSLTQELEESNEALQQQLEKIDEDRSDIIMYLKRMLQEKIDEIRELEERLKAAEETIQVDADTLEKTITKMNAEYDKMRDQLTSEIKLLEGKLNSLEEFRIQRDDLMKKYEAQEIAMEEQEKRHFKELYEIERKFIIKKDQLKKDMETKLLELSTKFQDATDLRVEATTHRVIRENISINNELDSLLVTQQRLYDDNNALTKTNVNLKQQIDLLEGEKNKALGKVKVQLKIIERLTNDHKLMKNQLERYKLFEQEVYTTRNDVKDITDRNRGLEHKIKVLEQNLHNVRCDRASVQMDMIYLKDENDRLKDILMEGVRCIRDAMSLGGDSDMSLRSTTRESLLNTLFILLSTAKEERISRPSVETIDSVDAAYVRGDLGFVPKVAKVRSKVPTTKTIECQTGSSFERFLQEEDRLKKSITSYGEEAEIWGEEELVLEEQLPSVLFFDESEMVPEEETAGSDYDAFAAMQDEEEEEAAEDQNKLAEGGEGASLEEKPAQCTEEGETAEGSEEGPPPDETATEAREAGALADEKPAEATAAPPPPKEGSVEAAAEAPLPLLEGAEHIGDEEIVEVEQHPSE